MSRPLRVILAESLQEPSNIQTALEKRSDVELLSVVSDGLKAIKAVRDYRADLLILDLVLAGIDGIGVLREIQVMGLSDPPTIVVCTALSSPHLINEAVTLGAVHCLLKPANPDWIVNRAIELCCQGYHKVVLVDGIAFAAGDVQRIITDIFRELGVPPHLLGYDYLRQSVLIGLEHKDMLHSITTRLYPKLASLNGSSPQRVERAIRHAIEATWNRGNIESIYQYFGYSVQGDRGRPTNSEFIARITDAVNMRLR